MIRIDDTLLEEIGLIALPKQERDQMLRQIYETLEMRVGMRLAERMTDQQLDEFERFIDTNDEGGALKWLETNFPDYKQVVADELAKLKEEIKKDSTQILETMKSQGVELDYNRKAVPAQAAPAQQSAATQPPQPMSPPPFQPPQPMQPQSFQSPQPPQPAPFAPQPTVTPPQGPPTQPDFSQPLQPVQPPSYQQPVAPVDPQQPQPPYDDQSQQQPPVAA